MITTAHLTEIDSLFSQQAANLQQLKAEGVSERLEKIKQIERYLADPEHENALAEAMYADLRKPRAEVITTEITPVLVTAKHIHSHLSSWMKDQSVGAPISMAGISSKIRYEPKGQALIISPWNYPFQLAINPLLYAIAAGNAVIIKPSEVAAHTSAFLKQMIASLFDPAEVVVVEGEVPVATALLAKPFNHIFFTGSPAVGKIVMRAAAEHLASVTLELGGKSPAIVDGTRDIETAATQIAWAKCLNNGQTCIAPDYVMVREDLLGEFSDQYAAAIRRFYNPDGRGVQASPDYGRLINAKHFARILSLLEDAEAKGAQIEIGGEMDEADLFMSPVLLTGITEEMTLMKEEIFGPLMPVLTYQELSEVTEMINRRPKPLAMYIQSNRRANVEFILANTSAGGTVINELMVSSVNPHLPFGGVNNSGIGKSNGKHGFVEFSNERGVLKRNWGTFSMIYPPYKNRMIQLLRWTTKL